jgi:hypothetical protein
MFNKKGRVAKSNTYKTNWNLINSENVEGSELVPLLCITVVEMRLSKIPWSYFKWPCCGHGCELPENLIIQPKIK